MGRGIREVDTEKKHCMWLSLGGGSFLGGAGLWGAGVAVVRKPVAKEKPYHVCFSFHVKLYDELLAGEAWATAALTPRRGKWAVALPLPPSGEGKVCSRGQGARVSRRRTGA